MQRTNTFKLSPSSLLPCGRDYKYNALQRIRIPDIKVKYTANRVIISKTKHPNKDPKIYCELHSTEC